MGFFTKTSGQGWSFDKSSGRLTISGDTGNALEFSDSMDKIRRKVRSVVAIKGARVRSIWRTFSGMKNLITADLTELDISECRSMFDMFSGCESLISLDLSTWDVSNANDLSYMFNFCRKLRTLNLGGWDTHNVINMSYIFAGCESLEHLDISGWHVGNDTKIENMFLGVPKTIYVVGNGSTDKCLLPEGVVLHQAEATDDPWPAKSAERAYKIGLGRLSVSNYLDAAKYFTKAAKLGVYDERVRADLADKLKYVGERILDNKDAKYNTEYYILAKECLEWAAHYGGSETAKAIGDMYFRRDNVPNNKTEALEWYETAANKGSRNGLFKLACMYYNGDGVPVDMSRAASLFEKAADRNLPEAQYMLGTMYYYGLGWCVKDLKKAKELVKKSADQGFEPAKEMLRDAF